MRCNSKAIEDKECVPLLILKIRQEIQSITKHAPPLSTPIKNLAPPNFIQNSQNSQNEKFMSTITTNLIHFQRVSTQSTFVDLVDNPKDKAY